MRTFSPLTLAALIAFSPAMLSAKPKPKAPSASQLQVQLKKLTKERDALKARLAATDSIQQDLSDAKKGRELARQELESCQKELGYMKATFKENQNGGEAILKELQSAKADLAASQAECATLKKEQEALAAKLGGPSMEGSLVILNRDIVPARPMNLSRVTPHAKHVDAGVVVVNVLINEMGEVVDSRLLQGLPGDSEWVKKANEACVEAAKRVVFDPARTVDGNTKVKVWQGVGFLLD